jgi:hypothetical protein
MNRRGTAGNVSPSHAYEDGFLEMGYVWLGCCIWAEITAVAAPSAGTVIGP